VTSKVLKDALGQDIGHLGCLKALQCSLQHIVVGERQACPHPGHTIAAMLPQTGGHCQAAYFNADFVIRFVPSLQG
jgi:hypothetical protein